ncbi:unnamed protein product, partial [Phaeothamnion confervicola]
VTQDIYGGLRYEELVSLVFGGDDGDDGGGGGGGEHGIDRPFNGGAVLGHPMTYFDRSNEHRESPLWDSPKRRRRAGEHSNGSSRHDTGTSPPRGTSHRSDYDGGSSGAAAVTGSGRRHLLAPDGWRVPFEERTATARGYGGGYDYGY